MAKINFKTFKLGTLVWIIASCLPLIVTHSMASAAVRCENVFEAQGIRGKLKRVHREALGSTGGKWLSDLNGTVWFVKSDVIYKDLQTSAEVISSQIYQFFGYRTPETVKFMKDGITYSASKDIGNGYATDFTDMNTSEIRQMRIVAAYLKDWDRLGNPENNMELRDGSLVILDFGGSLGSRAQGLHKPGEVVSDAIGSFEATSDIHTIYSSFKVQAPDDHPWRNINKHDAEAVVNKFKLLSDEKIEAIVNSAKYSKRSDRDYMIRALKIRRDGIISNLIEVIDSF